MICAETPWFPHARSGVGFVTKVTPHNQPAATYSWLIIWCDYQFSFGSFVNWQRPCRTTSQLWPSTRLNSQPIKGSVTSKQWQNTLWLSDWSVVSQSQALLHINREHRLVSGLCHLYSDRTHSRIGQPITGSVTSKQLQNTLSDWSVVRQDLADPTKHLHLPSLRFHNF